MKKILLLFGLLFLIFHFSLASDNSPLGARSAGIGGASVSLADIWSVQNNQAGLGFVRDMSAGVFYQNQFMVKELSTKAGAFALPVKGGTFGISISNFGYSLYSENKYGLAFGKSFGEKISAGVQMDYFSEKFGDAFYGTKNILAAEFGIIAKPLKNLTLAVHIFNPTKAKLTGYNDERISTIMRLGLNYKFSDKVFIACETEKNIDKKNIFKAGIEYQPIKELYLRAGISTNPSLSSFGVGINIKNFHVDISSTYHSVLGLSPQIGLRYDFVKTIKSEEVSK